MRQQVFVIHGGTSFDRHEDYIAFLKTREVSVERLQSGIDWRTSLYDDLGDDFEVMTPKMPNGANARYAEWVIWFERCQSVLRDGVILIGHSLGGIFLAKYLSEQSFPVAIGATVLVAAPFDATDTDESLTEFALPSSLEKFEKQGGKIYLVQSKDDPVVPFAEVEKYQQVLPAAKQLVFDDKGHFNEQHFPELVEVLKTL